MFIKGRVFLVNDQTYASDVNVLYSSLFSNGFLKNYFEGNIKEGNFILKIKQFLSLLPLGTIFCQDTRKNDFYICLPFFSSHFQQSIKPGEHVWIYPYKEQETIGNTNTNGYWLSRPHGLISTENTSYSFSDRDEIINKITNDDLNRNELIHLLQDVYVENESPMRSIKSNEQFNKAINSLSTEEYYNYNINDVTIRGSYNNAVSLTTENNMSSIKISAGINRKANKNFKDVLVYDTLNKKTKVAQSYLYHNPSANSLSYVKFNENYTESIKSLNPFITNSTRTLEGFDFNKSKLNFESLYDEKLDAAIIKLNEYQDNIKTIAEYNSPNVFEESSDISNIATQDSIYNSSKNKINKFKINANAINAMKTSGINLISESINLISKNTGGIHIGNSSSAIGLNSNKVKIMSDELLLNSDRIILGRGNEVEQLVKGNTLVTLIKDLIKIQLDTISLLNKTAIELEKHTHTINIKQTPVTGTAIVGGVSGSAIVPVASLSQQTNKPDNNGEFSKIDTNSKVDSTLLNEINQIQLNLEKILSSIAYIS